MTNDFNIPIDSAVTFKPGIERLYGAVVGLRGWVRKHRTDDEGFNLVWIEWDKDYWRYSGEPDGWTFEEHFSVIDGTSIEPKMDKLPEAPSQWMEDMMATVEAEDAGLSDSEKEFMDNVVEGASLAGESDAFITVSVRVREIDEGLSVAIPEVYADALTPEAAAVLREYLIKLAQELKERHEPGW